MIEMMMKVIWISQTATKTTEQRILTNKKKMLKPLKNFFHVSTVSITTLRRGNSVYKNVIIFLSHVTTIENTLMILEKKMELPEEIIDCLMYTLNMPGNMTLIGLSLSLFYDFILALYIWKMQL